MVRFLSLTRQFWWVAVACSLPVTSFAQAGPSTADQAAVSKLTLEAAMLAAENDNIDVLRSRLAVRTAEANRKIADTAPNPNLNLSAVQIRPNLIGTRRVDQIADTLVSVDMVLERGGKRVRDLQGPGGDREPGAW